MRLRPSGSQGPVATKLASFIDYQRNSAWTWEHLALTRARVVSGPPELRQTIERTIAEVLRRKRDRAQVAADVRVMRNKIEEEKGTRDIWDLKHVRGGADRYRVPDPVPASGQRARASRGARSEYRGRAQQAAAGGSDQPCASRSSRPGGDALPGAHPMLAALSRQALRPGRGAARAQRFAGAGLRHA